jgi:hypothetical protein
MAFICYPPFRTWTEDIDMNNSYLFGMAFGILIAVGIFAVIELANKKRGVEAKYDERQEFVRGKAYKLGFMTLLIYCVAVGMIDLYLGGGWCDVYTAFMLGFFTAVTVFVVKCILTDAYFTVGQHPAGWLVLTGIISAVNLAVFAADLNGGKRIFENGSLTHNTINLAGGAAFLIIFAAMLVKTLKDRAAER